MNRILLLTAAVLVVHAGVFAYALEPANPQASPKARAIVDYLDGLSRQPEKRLVSGQFTDFGPGAKLTCCQTSDEDVE